MFSILRNISIHIATISIETIQLQNTNHNIDFTVLLKAADQRYGSQERLPCFVRLCHMSSMFLLMASIGVMFLTIIGLVIFRLLHLKQECQVFREMVANFGAVIDHE